MSMLSQFYGRPQVPTAIVNHFATSGRTPMPIGNGNYGVSVLSPGAAKTIDSGALAANVLGTLLSVSGSGTVSLATVWTQGGGTRTIRVRITIDGVVVFDATSGNATAAFQGVAAIGSHGPATTDPVVLDQKPFNSSLLIEACTNITETGYLKLAVLYDVRAG